MNNQVDSVDRIGTTGEQSSDHQKIETIKKYAFRSYQDEVVVKMPYVDLTTTSFSLAAGLSAYQQFKVNSIFDPDLTGAGHQPLGRDTWAAIYNYYKVLEVNIHFEIVDLRYTNAASAGNAIDCPTLHGGMLDITATPPATRSAWFEAYEVNECNRQQEFSKPIVYNVIGSRGGNSTHVSMKWTPELFEKNIIQGGNDAGWTAIGGDPTILEYFSLLANNPEAVVRPIAWIGRLEYIVAFKQVNKTLLNTNQ
nr:MAG: capsid protein [Cressdnaviricota sp.]